MNIELSVACRSLVNLDIMTLTDPFIKVFEQQGSTYNLIGTTEVVYNNLNPNFNTGIKIEFYFESKQQMKIEVYHKDSATKDVMIGIFRVDARPS